MIKITQWIKCIWLSVSHSAPYVTANFDFAKHQQKLSKYMKQKCVIWQFMMMASLEKTISAMNVKFRRFFFLTMNILMVETDACHPNDFTSGRLHQTWWMCQAMYSSFSCHMSNTPSHTRQRNMCLYVSIGMMNGWNWMN